jgi:hypothetical protein
VQQTGANTFLTSEVEEAFNQLGVPVREGREVAVEFRMVVDRLAERAEDDPLLRQLFTVGGRHRHRVEYRVQMRPAPPSPARCSRPGPTPF